MVALLVLYLIRPEDGSLPPGPGQGSSDGDGAGEVFRGFGSKKTVAPHGILSGWPGAGSNRRPSDFQSDARTN